MLDRLRFQVDMGVDEFLMPDPVCWMDTAAPDSAPPDSAHALGAQAASVQRDGAAPAMAGSEGHTARRTAQPRPITARPVQSSQGAGTQAAEAAAQAASSLDALKAALDAFDGGAIKRSAKSTIFAEGDPAAPLMLVGDAPDAEDDAAGRPFQGAPGALLDAMLAAIGVDRATQCYISYLIPWRPLGGRGADDRLVATYRPFLMRHVALARPGLVLAFGTAAARALTGRDDTISRLRGRWMTASDAAGGATMMPLFQPRYLLRQPAAKAQAWRDLLAVQARLTHMSPHSVSQGEGRA